MRSATGQNLFKRLLSSTGDSCASRRAVGVSRDLRFGAPTTLSMGKKKNYTCYGARKVRNPGVYSTWADCVAATAGQAGEEHKGFHSRAEAEDWVRAGPQGRSQDQPRQQQPSKRPAGSVAIDCPFREKDEAKALGARWDGSTWYVPAGRSLAPFARWLPPGAAAGSSNPRPHGGASSSSGSGGGASSSSGGGASSHARASSASNNDGIRPGELALYTDGACKGNQHVSTSHLPAGWGVAVVQGRANADGGECIHELCGPVELSAGAADFLGATVGSNNTGELTGVCMALKWLIDEGGAAPAAICYDSEYAANQVQGKWKTNKNHALVDKGKALLRRAAEGRSVRFVHVKGHSNHVWNDLADELANRGERGERSGRGAPPPAVAGAPSAKRKRHDDDEEDYQDLLAARTGRWED